MVTFYIVAWHAENFGLRYLLGDRATGSWYLATRFDTVAAAREAAAGLNARGWYLERVTREDIDPDTTEGGR